MNTVIAAAFLKDDKIVYAWEEADLKTLFDDMYAIFIEWVDIEVGDMEVR